MQERCVGKMMTVGVFPCNYKEESHVIVLKLLQTNHFPMRGYGEMLVHFILNSYMYVIYK